MTFLKKKKYKRIVFYKFIIITHRLKTKINKHNDIKTIIFIKKIIK